MTNIVYHISIYTLLQCLSLLYADSRSPEYCPFVHDVHFDACTHKNDEQESCFDQEMDGLYGGNSRDNNADDVCINNNICRNIFNLTRIRNQSFSRRILAKLSEMFRYCCGACAKYRVAETSNRISQMDESTLEESDIIYPVIGQSSFIGVHGFYFVPIFEVPSALYFTLKMSETEIAITIAKSCLGMWPLLTICLLLSFVAGFICWAMETPFNKKEFPRDFCDGVFEGFWWSIVSMTTVGYGDKTPKSPWGRLFAVVWIAVGISICSIYCASLTTEIMNLRSPDTPSLRGQLVGCLRYRFHDKIMIAQHGGKLKAVDYNDTVLGIADLMKLVEKKEIDGFLINKASYHCFSRAIEEKEEYSNVLHSISHIHMRFQQTPKYFYGEKIVSGMLVKNESHYDYFHRYFRNNWLEIQTCASYTLNHIESHYDSVSYVRLKGLFHQFVYWSLGLLGIIVTFGIIYEFRRRYDERKARANIEYESEELHHGTLT